MRKRDAANQIVEITPRGDKPHTGNIETRRRNFDSNKVMTPKVDFNSKSSTNFQVRKIPISNDFGQTDKVKRTFIISYRSEEC